MLNEEVANLLSDRLVRRYENLNTYIIKQIGETIKQIGKLTPTQAMQLEAILKYGGSFDKITKEISKITKLSVKDIYEIYEKLAIQDQRFASTFYKYRGIDMIPYKYNEPLKREVQALAKITADTFINISGTEMLGYGFVDDKTGKITYKGLKQAYYDIIDEAILSVSQGKGTFDNRMYKIIRDMGESGLKVIYPTTYQVTDKKTGKIITKHYTRRLDSVIRTTMQTGIRNINNELQELFGNEFGADGVEISTHQNSAIDHQSVQGKQFSTVKPNEFEMSEWEKLNNGQDAKDYKGNIYNLDHDGNGSFRPISTMNCYHYIFSVVLGVSNPLHSDKELKQMIDKNEKGFEYKGKHYTLYETEQLMRRLELELRKAKDEQIMGRASGIVENVEKAQNKITKLTQKYNEIIKLSGLPSQLQRAKVSQYKRINVSKMK